MRKILTTILLICLVAHLIAQSRSVASELIALNNYDSKAQYYEQSELTIDQVELLLSRTEKERERLELLLFYIRKQFLYDVSLGREQIDEALILTRDLGLQLHEGIALDNLTTHISTFESREVAHSYADSALAISRKIKDKVLESSIYYTKFFIDMVNENHSESLSNLLKCVELTDNYASPIINNKRQVRLMMFAYKWRNLGLVETQLKKLEFKSLIEEDKITYLIYQGYLQKEKGNVDSAKVYYFRAFDYSQNHDTYFELGKWYMENGQLDSAIHLIHKSIEVKDPRGSYFDLRYQSLAETYKMKNENGLVEKYYKKAIEECIRLVEKNNEAAYRSQLASFYYDIHQLDSAFKYAQLSYNQAVKNDYQESIEASTLILSKIAEKNGDKELANSYLKEHLAQVKINNQLKIINQLKKAEIDREINYWNELSDQKIGKAEQFRNLIVIIAVLLFLLFVVVLVMLIDKRKALTLQKKLNEHIWEQKDQIENQGEELKAMNDELERRVSRRTEELQKANIKLSDYSQRLEQYAKLTAHNLRAPLANIMGLVNVFHAHDLSEDNTSNTIHRINKSAEEMDEVIQELTALMDIENVGATQNEKVNLPELINGLEQWLIKKTDRTDLEIIKKIDLNEVVLMKSYLERSLKELLSNSYNYRDVQKELNIRLSIERNNGEFLIKVEDNGVGIDLKQYGNKIFQLHQRFNEKIHGRGVGLYLVKRQVEALHGNVSVDSELGEGTCFTITLPLEPSIIDN